MVNISLSDLLEFQATKGNVRKTVDGFLALLKLKS
jgi:hypothetical protein